MNWSLVRQTTAHDADVKRPHEVASFRILHLLHLLSIMSKPGLKAMRCMAAVPCNDSTYQTALCLKKARKMAFMSTLWLHALVKTDCRRWAVATSYAIQHPTGHGVAPPAGVGSGLAEVHRMGGSPLPAMSPLPTMCRHWFLLLLIWLPEPLLLPGQSDSSAPSSPKGCACCPAQVGVDCMVRRGVVIHQPSAHKVPATGVHC